MSWDGTERRKRPRDRSGKPPCEKCGHDESWVKDSDVEYVPKREGVYIRQRECKNCGHRWFTAEENYSRAIYGSDRLVSHNLS